MARTPIEIYNEQYGDPATTGRFTPTQTAAQVNAAIDADIATARGLGIASLSDYARKRVGQSGNNPDDLLAETTAAFNRKPALAAACSTTPAFPGQLAAAHASIGGMTIILSALADQCRDGRLRCALELRDRGQDLSDGCLHLIGDPNTAPTTVMLATAARAELTVITSAASMEAIQAAKDTRKRHQAQAAANNKAADPAALQGLANSVKALPTAATTASKSKSRSKKKSTKKAVTKS